MKKIIALLVLLSFFSVNGQNEKELERTRQLYATAKSKPLYVVLDVENSKHVEKLTKKGKTEELQNYKDLINNYNTYIKSAVTEYLNIFPSVKYITTTELKELKTKDFKTINILLRTFPMEIGYSSTLPQNSVPGSPTGGAAWFEKDIESVDIDLNNVKDKSIIEFRTYFSDDMSPLFSQPLNKLFCSKGEVFYAVRQLRRIIDDALSKTDASVLTEKSKEIMEGLKTRTLIINKIYLKPGLTEADIKSIYPYNFSLVEPADFDAELTKKNKDVLILIPIFYPAPNGYMMGAFHTIYDSNTEYVYWPNAKKCVGEIEKKHFSYYPAQKK